MQNLNFVEKYRPSKLSDLILDENIKNMFLSYLKESTIKNFCFAGRPGVGKTSLAKIISKEINATELYVNCGYENGIDAIRYKVNTFCEASAFNGQIKLVILDEADALTSNAQEGLRNTIESASEDTRFILTCNYINRIISPIQSRCTPINLSYSINDVAKRILQILKKEKIEFDNNSLKLFIEVVIKNQFPDIRSIVNILEQSIITGKLIVTELNQNKQIEDIAKYILANIKSSDIRKYYITNEDKFNSDYEVLTGKLFNLLMNEPEKQIKIAEYLFRMQTALDKEIYFYSLILELR